VSERIGHYELLERIAEGGMGVVYRARDTRLDREVALKFLSPTLAASEEELDRFLHEARAISRLNHTNIATIYAVEEERGERFLAFEYVAGGSLADRLHQTNEPLEISQILSWSSRLARALAHAHRHGIVHRDVKPHNVLLTTDNVVKLSDFGVAQVKGQMAGTGGSTASTAAYMSPEQALELDVDHHSDMYSFGVMLYELAAGALPFTDKRHEVILYDVINTPVPSLKDSRPDVPEAFAAIVDRLLQKQPDLRYDRMEDVVTALETLMQAPVPSLAQMEPTVAVLPLVDMSPHHDQEYFCDGLTEETILALSSVQGLRVVSKTSSSRFKGGYDIAEIGRQLGVDSILEGSVKKSGAQLRITVQLIRVSDGIHLWSQRYDRRVEDIFAIQDEISNSIAESLKLRLTTAPVKSRKKTSNVDAYNAYLEGRSCLNQRTPLLLDRALKRFETAVQLDRNFAAAYAGIAEVQIVLASGQFGGDGSLVILDRARKAAERALQLDPSLAEAHVAMALVRHRADWAWDEAEKEFVRAIELNPNYATAHHQYAMFLAIHLRLEEARAEIAIAHQLDPLSLIISTAVGRIFHFSRQFNAAIEQCKKTIDLEPTFSPAYFDLAVSYLAHKDYDLALKAIECMYELDNNELRRVMMMAFWHAAQGQHNTAVEWGDRYNELATKHHVSPMLSALLEVGLGNMETAMSYMEQALEVRDSILVYLQCEPAWDDIRAHPRYPQLVAKLGFPPPPAVP
jgi:serine/threonine protein kinase/Tfp pilus assembly protein PilF